MFDRRSEEFADSDGTYAPVATRCSDCALRTDPSLAAISGETSRARAIAVGRSRSVSIRTASDVSVPLTGTPCARADPAAVTSARRTRTVKAPADRIVLAGRRKTAMSLDIGVELNGRRIVLGALRRTLTIRPRVFERSHDEVFFVSEICGIPSQGASRRSRNNPC